MVDRVLEVDPGKRLIALKNVTINDQVLSAHFPGRPVLPGSLIIEGMAQTAILLYCSRKDFNANQLPNYYLGSVKAHFFKPVLPGDQIKMEAIMVKLMPKGLYIEVKVFVKKEKVAEADLVCMVEK